MLWLGVLLAGPAFAAGPQAETGAWRQCAPAGGAIRCHAIQPQDAPLRDPITTLIGTVRIDGDAARTAAPLSVQIVAMASSEIWWNGVPIGRNGRVGADAAHEVPGAFSTTMLVPPGLVRPGANRVMVRLSAHHLWLPVARPVHRLAVGPYADPASFTIRHYLPTLLVLGVLALGFLRAAGVAILDPARRNARPICAIAGLVLLQAIVETSKLVPDYAYPWQVARIVAIAGLAATTALLLARLAARHFVPGHRRAVTVATALAIVAALLMIGSYDGKALVAFQAGAAAALLCALAGGRRDPPMAILTAVLAAAAIAFATLRGTLFLDIGYFSAVALLVAAFSLRELLVLRGARTAAAQADGEAQASKAALQQALRDRPAPPVEIRDGSRVHLVAPADILFLKAADDYCDVHLRDGRRLLATATLAATLELLPAAFVRIHRSHAINVTHLSGTKRTAGGGRVAALAGGTLLPIGRRYAPNLVAPYFSDLRQELGIEHAP